MNPGARHRNALAGVRFSAPALNHHVAPSIGQYGCRPCAAEGRGAGQLDPLGGGVPDRRIACCTREAERCAIAIARSARPPAAGMRPSWREIEGLRVFDEPATVVGGEQIDCAAEEFGIGDHLAVHAQPGDAAVG